MQNSGAAAIRAQAVQLNGYAGVVVAEKAELGNTYAGVVVGQEVHGQRIESLVLLARHVDGEVKTVLDTRGAILMGLVGGLFAGLMFLLTRALFGRKS